MSKAEVEAASLSELAATEAACRRCPLYRDATQVVPGEDQRHARMMLVGEQPGDQEALAGRPFVGPAGRIFDRTLAEAGIPRDRIFVTMPSSISSSSRVASAACTAARTPARSTAANGGWGRR